MILAIVLCDVYSKIVEAVTCISYIWQLFFVQPVARIALFLMLCCHALLGSIFYKIRTSKCHTNPKYVKSK